MGRYRGPGPTWFLLYALQYPAGAAPLFALQSERLVYPYGDDFGFSNDKILYNNPKVIPILTNFRPYDYSTGT